MKNTVRPAIFLILALLASLAGCGERRADGPEAVFHTASGSPVLKVEVARTIEERTKGLMGRESLAADAGMIFVFEQPARTGFWMKDTLIPLSIAFVDQQGVIIDIQDMEPGSLQSHAPPGPFVYAIEANRGYFREHGISAGDRVELRLEQP